MRKFIGVILFLLFASVLTLSASNTFENPTGEEYTWHIREMPMITRDSEGVVTQRTEYCLRFSNPAADQMDTEIYQSGVMVAVYAYKPLDPEDTTMDVPCEWVVDVVDSRYGVFQTYPLFDDEVWPYVPQQIKWCLKILKHDNPKLFFIYVSSYTGTITVYYIPKYDENKRFYELKLQVIKAKFMKIQDWDEEIPSPCLENKFNPQSKTNI